LKLVAAHFVRTDTRVTRHALDLTAGARDEMPAVAVMFEAREHLGDRRRVARDTGEVSALGHPFVAHTFGLPAPSRDKTSANRSTHGGEHGDCVF